MSKLCALVFIFMMYTRKFEYIVMSILVNGFYFLRKITALRPSVTKFLKEVAQLDLEVAAVERKKGGNKIIKMVLWQSVACAEKVPTLNC